MKSRQHIYFDKDLTARLTTHSARTGASKSSVVADAVRAYLDSQGARELDDLLGMRMGRVERDINILTESFALFVRYYLTMMAPVAEADKAALAVGKERFQAFIDQVGRKIASGRTFNFDQIAARETEEDS
ncbi:MAG: CopG family transcriptional regulator [Rhodospirillaceae bacterium]